MERRRSGRGGWGRDLSIFTFGRLKLGAEGWVKPSDLVGLTPVLSSKSEEKKGLQRYRGLWDLHRYGLGSLFPPEA